MTTTEKTSPVDEGYVTIPEAAAFLRVGRSTIYQLMDGGELPYAKIGKARRIPRRALREYAERCLVGAGNPQSVA